MSSSCKLHESEGGQSVDQKFYRRMIDLLLYLTASRLDISFSVGMCARFQSNPKEIHHQATKRIFKYLECTQHLGLWYSKSSLFELVILGGNLVSWSSQK